MPQILLGDLKTFIRQVIPEFKITSWSQNPSADKVPSESLIKPALDNKANYSGYTPNKNLATNANGQIITEDKTVIPEVSIGTFGDLQDIIDEASANDIITLTQDYKNTASDPQININKALTIVGNGHTIDGNNQSQIFNIASANSSSVNIHNILFTNGSGTNGGAVSGGTIVDSIFTNNIGTSGGALSNATAINCKFIKNSASVSGGAMSGGVAIQCIFNQNTASTGPAIIDTNAINCRFDNNNETYNSTVKDYITEYNIKTINNESLLGTGNINITNGAIVGTFTDLQALITSASSGDKITLDKDYKYDSTTDSSLSTGIVINKTLTIYGNGHIIDGNNSARGFNIDRQSVDIDGIIFQNCKATESNGGAITINQNTVNIINCDFINNSCTNEGGAIVTTNGAVIDIVNCNFINNSSTGSSGALFISDYNTVNIENCKFIKNTVSNGAGGAIYGFKGNTINIKNSLFTNNSAKSGGAIRTYNYTTLNLINTDVIKNSATSGNTGGISSEWTCVVNIKDSKISNNTATGSYANIYAVGSTNVYNCTINDIATTCYNITNKTYLSDHQDISDKINSSDIANNLTTNDSSKVLSAAQGYQLNNKIGEAISFINS